MCPSSFLHATILKKITIAASHLMRISLFAWISSSPLMLSAFLLCHVDKEQADMHLVSDGKSIYTPDLILFFFGSF